MNDFQKGFREVAIGIISGVTISAVLRGFAQDGLIPSYMVFLFTVCGFLGAILLMLSFATSGIIFTVGWIVGALILKDMLTTFDFVVYLVAPIVVLVARGVVYFYSRNFNN
jgi:hypothetical protein